MEKSAQSNTAAFTPYQLLVIAILAFLQFTIILDFMILSPLGAILIPELKITPAQFAWVVSVYAFSAGASGILAAGFADRFDRKKLLVFFYSGFVIATLFCGIAPDYNTLVAARLLTGIFGGVIGSISFAIVTDLFPFEKRGRVMGIVQSAFAASQVMGLPLGLYLANHWGWHSPFLLIVAVSTPTGILILVKLKPINEHLKLRSDRSALRHLWHTFATPRYLQGFATTALLSTGGFMLLPFSSAFSVHNLGIQLDHLPIVYMVTGCSSIVIGPLIGRLSDRLGQLRVFLIGSLLTMIMVTIYTRLGVTPMALVIFINIFIWAGISARLISSSALMSALPAAADRGSYMSVSSSVQQISGGLAATLAGLIVIQNTDGTLEHFDRIGLVLIGTTVLTGIMMIYINRYIQSQRSSKL